MDVFDTAQPAGFWREQLTFVGLTVTEWMAKRTLQGTILRVQHRRIGTVCTSRRTCSLHAAAELWQRLAYVEPKPDVNADARTLQGMF
jgi:hypothetical protein